MIHKKPVSFVNKVLVCITPQSNSRRLIDFANKVAQNGKCELHILHVEKGADIFIKPQTSEILQDLFDYGSEVGGIVHAICADDISTAIKDFVKQEGITSIVLGEPQDDVKIASAQVIENLSLMLPYIKIEILGRETEY